MVYQKITRRTFVVGSMGSSIPLLIPMAGAKSYRVTIPNSDQYTGNKAEPRRAVFQDMPYFDFNPQQPDSD